ncbi:uncharacterized protein ACO6RY_18887 [Pungitius sinensis]
MENRCVARLQTDTSDDKQWGNLSGMGQRSTGTKYQVPCLCVYQRVIIFLRIPTHSFCRTSFSGPSLRGGVTSLFFKSSRIDSRPPPTEPVSPVYDQH